MKILLAEHLGMCFGVRDAITLAREQATRAPLTILGELVHNERVLGDLRERGIQIAKDSSQVETPSVMITAHGASEKTIGEARERGLHVMEATCPLVRVAHTAVARLVREGFHPVIIGQKDHVEVRGLTGDLRAFDVVLSEVEIMQLQPRARFGVAAQTTQPIAKVERLVTWMRRCFSDSEIRFFDTVCRPTKDRQRAAEELARRSDVVVVIGGAHSNNTRELASTCSVFCAHVHHVQTAADLRPEWFAHAQTVGLTAGTSTPDQTIAEVEAWLRELAGRVERPASRPNRLEQSNLQTACETLKP